MRCAFIPGWQMQPGIWQDTIRFLHQQGIDADAIALPESPAPTAIHEWQQSLHHYDVFVGWSLGAALLLELIREQKLNTQGVLLITCAGAFSRQNPWDQSLPADLWSDFMQRYRINAEKGMHRFIRLMVKGVPDQEQYAEAVSDHVVLNHHNGLAWLAWMQQWSAAQIFPEQPVSVSVLAGGGDCIVPEAGCVQLAQQHDFRCDVIEQGGHIPFLTRPQEFRDCLMQHLRLHGYSQ